MSDFNNDVPYEYRPLGAWKYFWLEVLFSIPVIGLIFTIVFACGASGNKNLTNFARSRFCVLALVLIIALIIIAITVFTGGMSSLVSYFS
ncbi:MAG: hypothetical protein K5669_03280 [Lachnospiraceae bacterium]|nr:hypothetical protein [Lachnospiraceae bacterium]